MSRPTTWILIRLNGWRTFCSTFPAASSPSPMIDRSWTGSPRALWNSTEASSGLTPETSRNTRYRKKSSWRRRLSSQPKPTSFWHREEVWIRRGVEARRTRSQSRISRLEHLRARREARREVVGSVRMDVATGGSNGYQGKIVAELTGVGKSFGDKTIVRNFTGTILRGDKVGLIGPNGAGKTTLLKMILSELAPDEGTIRQGANLQVAYFDQMRHAVNLDATLEDFISPGSEWIEIGNQPQTREKLSERFPVLSGPRALSGSLAIGWGT